MDTSKIIKGVVSNGRYTVTAPIVKEDYGLYLQIEGVELPSTYEVDFSNSESSGTSVTMIGNADGVLIPRQFIDSGKDVFAFLYHVGANYGKTVYKFRIPNKVRPDRTDEEPTPEEQSTIDQAISALNTAVEQTAQDKADADVSAQNASADAERAEEARTDAQNYASQAEQSATDAYTYALSANAASGTAGNYADVAGGYASQAQTAAQTATNKASAASQSATNASNSATTASTKAGEASASATTASNKASEASGYATTASNKATEASGYASTASQKASDASDSATAALGYKTAAQTAQGLAEQAQTGAETAQGKAEDAQEAAETAAASIQSSASQIAQNTADIADLQTDVAQNEADILKAFPTDSASGAIASFTDGADGIPLKSLIVDINPVQDLSNGDPSPENICPISGWTGMQLKTMGKNLLDPTLLKDQEAWNIIRVYAPVGTRLTMSTNNSNVTTATGLLCFFKRHSESQGSSNIVSASHPVTRTVYDDGYVEVVQRNPSGTLSFDDFQWQIEIGSTPTLYEPYNGTTIPINFGQTVYSGKLDVLSGILTVYPEYDSYNGETLTGEWISDRDVYAVGTTPTIGAQVVNIGAEGTEIQLEPHEVASLLGQNNIFADTGDTEVEYRADTKLYIERLTAPDSADMIADANITSGQYFMVGNSLYKATANIANGGQIIVGTNATRVSLAQALNEINA